MDFVKVHATIPRDAYFGVMDEARKLDMAVAGHLPRAVSPAEASDAGQRTLEHVDTLFDGRLPKDGTAEQVAAAIARFRVEEARALFDRFARNGTWFTPTLVLLDQNPLEDIRNTQTIRAVIRHGKLLDREALEALRASAERAGREP